MERTETSKVTKFCVKILLAVGIAVAFYQLPGIVADKISYWKIKNKQFKQEQEED